MYQAGGRLDKYSSLTTKAKNMAEISQLYCGDLKTCLYSARI